MQNWTLALLALTGLLAATVPLVLVWRSADSNKYRKLAWVTVFLTFDLIVFGAFTRLTDSGLGCPDWPGCYGLANPFLAHAQISAAETLLPSGPVTVVKAWIEMIHRFLASAIGLLCLALMAWAIVRWRAARRSVDAPALPAAAFALVCVQGLFGALTVTMKLQPVIVTTHLLLGMLLLVPLTWLGARHDRLPGAGAGPAGVRAVRRLALLSAVLLLVQIALGGWVSTNYATLACSDYPLCGGQLLPQMDFGHGFTLWRKLGMTAAGDYLPLTALTAIHWVHRNFALLVIAGLGWTVWRAWPLAPLRREAGLIAAVLLLQASTGIATLYLNFPLPIAVLHNAGAAVLVLLVTMLNYKAQHQLGTAPQAHASRT
ncbi:MAG: COX15/CtaA family protein [Pseudomonadota bacterium]